MYNLYICCGLLLALFVLCLCFILFLSCAFPDLFTMGCLVMSGGNYLSSSMVITLSMGLPAAYLGWSLWQHPWFCTTEHPPFFVGIPFFGGKFSPRILSGFSFLGHEIHILFCGPGRWLQFQCTVSRLLSSNMWLYSFFHRRRCDGVLCGLFGIAVPGTDPRM